MNSKEQIELIEQMDRDLTDILKSKGEDYSTDGDRLENFKRLAGAVKELKLDMTTSYGVAMFMVIMKVDRINNLLRTGKGPNNEGIEDSFKDGTNYFKLAYCCYKDRIL